MLKSLFILVIFTFTISGLSAQGFADSNLVQFSGMVVTDQRNEPLPIPYTHIGVENTRRGTYADRNGFFSLVVQKGDRLIFTAVGFKPAHYIVPSDLPDNRYSVFQILYSDTLTLPETVIYPWPSREHFKLEFLALDVSDKMREIANKNLADKAMANLRNSLPRDGGENYANYQQQVVQSYYYAGQYRPVNLFNVVAWKKFFDAWKEGKFKKKKED
ncbi:MAG: carboxypeptidase-like regulatory domain-containing protein [Saprospiraceae bacterium]